MKYRNISIPELVERITKKSSVIYLMMPCAMKSLCSQMLRVKYVTNWAPLEMGITTWISLQMSLMVSVLAFILGIATTFIVLRLVS